MIRPHWPRLVNRMMRGEHVVMLYFGRRGISLFLVGIMWIVNGGRYMATPPPPAVPGYGLALTQALPHQWVGLAWMIAGVIGLMTSFRREPGKDAIGFAAISSMPALYCAASILSTIIEIFNLAPTPPSPWGSAIVWLVCFGFIRLVAGWAEPQPLTNHGG